MLAATLIALPTLVPALPNLSNQDWLGWRGPGGNGVADGSPPLEWSEDKNVRWKIDIPGKGTSSPVVAGDLVFVTSAISIGEAEEPEEQPAQPERGRGGAGRGGRGSFGGRPEPTVEQEFLVIALNRTTGEVEWEQVPTSLTPHQGTHRDGSFASPTPVTDGEILIASFGSFGVFAYDMAGELKWEKDLGDMDIVRDFGEGSSPVLHGNSLVMNWDHGGESFLVALNKNTGVELWRKEREVATTWCTPLIIETESGPHVIIGAAETIAYDLKTGEKQWSFGAVASAEASEPQRGEGAERGGEEGGRGGEEGGRGGPGQGRGGARGGSTGSGVITSPVHHRGILLMSSGSRRGSFRAIALAQAKADMKADAKALLWSSEGDTPHIPSPIAYNGMFYSLKSNSGLLSAFEVASGKRVYGPERMKGLG
ncbi:MAG: outer membrane protein assembly factor BamB, partial [Planctomycetota bacterium]